MAYRASLGTSWRLGLGALAVACLGTTVKIPTAAAGAADVVACRKIAAREARLDCFDRTSVGLEADLASEQKSSFDLFGLFSNAKVVSDRDFGKSQTSGANAADATGAGGEPPTKAVPEISQIDAKLADLSMAGGRAVFYFDNGQVWEAQDEKWFRLRRDGTDHAVIRRALLGYVIRVNDLAGETPVRRIK